MSAVSEVKNVYQPVFSKEKFDEINKKYYGLNNNDLDEISNFINEFGEVMKSIPEIATYDDLKPLVDKCNKIPSHCGYIVCSYYVNNNGDISFNKIVYNLYTNYKSLNEEDPESTKTTDLYETLACLIQFGPQKTIRKFIVDNLEVSKEIYKIMRKRPSTFATMSARYAELFVTSKFDMKYADLIYENLNAMLEFLKTKNGEIQEVNDAVNINFNQLRDLMQDFYNRDKKESLKKINKLINKKGDIGEAFFYFVALNPSCSLEVISKHPKITSEFITKFLCQLKIQYIVELATFLENIPQEKQGFMQYINSVYKIADFDGCYERLSNIARKEGIGSYGVLLRQVSFYPNITMSENDNLGFVCEQLKTKLSSVANNLTADVSEKSMSITIVPLGRSRIYQDIMDRIEGVDANGGGGFAAKLRDKDIIKKIRESGLSWYTMDQCTGTMMMSVLQIIEDVYKANPQIDRDNMIKTAYKNMVLQYGIIMTLPYFRYLIEGLETKMSTVKFVEPEDDYEDM